MDTGVKKRMLRAAGALLDEKDIGSITSRDIARLAGVGLGSINYHFKSRDDLLMQAAFARFEGVAEGFRRKDAVAADPKAELEQQMIDMLQLMLAMGDIGRFVLRRKLSSRTFTAERHMLKYIRQFYEGCTLSPLALKLKASQLSAVATMAFFNPEAFCRYTDIDLNLPEERELFIKTLISSVLNHQQGDGYEKES